MQLSLECKEVRSALEEQTSQMMAIQQERDIAITTLNKHGLASQVADHVTDHMTLRQQNEELHGVIRQMRQELEQLAHLSETPRGIIHEQDGHAPPTSGYVQYMEKELIRMKSENRQLLERLQQTTPSGKPPTPTLSSGQRSPSPPRTSNSAQVGSGERRQHRGHLIALSDTIASLQKEKASLELSIVQLRSRVEELETDLNKEKEQVCKLSCKECGLSVVCSVVKWKVTSGFFTMCCYYMYVHASGGE